ncbi:Rap-GAP domain-containing protein, variant 2 [Balamuthia mandrillaris]
MLLDFLVHELGFLDANPESAVFKAFPLAARKALCHHVTSSFLREGLGASALSSPTHLRVILECVGQAFALEIDKDSLPIVAEAVELYRQWLLEPAKCPPSIAITPDSNNLHRGSFIREMMGHFSQLFSSSLSSSSTEEEICFDASTSSASPLTDSQEMVPLTSATQEEDPVQPLHKVQGSRKVLRKPRIEHTLISNQPPDSSPGNGGGQSFVRQHALLCRKVLKILLELSLRQPKMDEQTWDHLLKIVLGITHNLLRLPDTDPLSVELCPPLLKVLFELVLRSQTRDVSFWKSLQELLRHWRHRSATITHWSAVLAGITSRVIAILYGSTVGANYVVIPSFNDEATSSLSLADDFVYYAWYHFLNLLGDIEGIQSANNHLEALQGIGTVTDLFLNLSNHFPECNHSASSQHPQQATKKSKAKKTNDKDKEKEEAENNDKETEEDEPNKQAKQGLLRAPDGNTIFHIVGPFIFEAMNLCRKGFERGQAKAIQIACKVVARKHRNTVFHPAYLAYLCRALERGLVLSSSGGGDYSFLMSVILDRTVPLWSIVELPGGFQALLPHFLHAISRVLTVSSSSAHFPRPTFVPAKALRRSCVQLLASFLSFPGRYPQCPFIGTKQAIAPANNAASDLLPVSAFIQSYDELNEMIGELLLCGLATEEDPQNQQKLLWTALAYILENVDRCNSPPASSSEDKQESINKKHSGTARRICHFISLMLDQASDKKKHPQQEQPQQRWDDDVLITALVVLKVMAQAFHPNSVYRMRFTGEELEERRKQRLDAERELQLQRQKKQQQQKQQEQQAEQHQQHQQQKNVSDEHEAERKEANKQLPKRSNSEERLQKGSVIRRDKDKDKDKEKHKIKSRKEFILNSNVLFGEPKPRPPRERQNKDKIAKEKKNSINNSNTSNIKEESEKKQKTRKSSVKRLSEGESITPSASASTSVPSTFTSYSVDPQKEDDSSSSCTSSGSIEAVPLASINSYPIVPSKSATSVITTPEPLVKALCFFIKHRMSIAKGGAPPERLILETLSCIQTFVMAGNWIYCELQCLREVVALINTLLNGSGGWHMATESIKRAANQLYLLLLDQHAHFPSPALGPERISSYLFEEEILRQHQHLSLQNLSCFVFQSHHLLSIVNHLPNSSSTSDITLVCRQANGRFMWNGRLNYFVGVEGAEDTDEDKEATENAQPSLNRNRKHFSSRTNSRSFSSEFDDLSYLDKYTTNMSPSNKKQLQLIANSADDRIAAEASFFRGSSYQEELYIAAPPKRTPDQESQDKANSRLFLSQTGLLSLDNYLNLHPLTSSKTLKAFKKTVDSQLERELYSIGVLHVSNGNMSPCNIFERQVSDAPKAFLEFLSSLGWKTNLSQHESVAKSAFYWADLTKEILFQSSTLIPRSAVAKASFYAHKVLITWVGDASEEYSFARLQEDGCSSLLNFVVYPYKAQSLFRLKLVCQYSSMQDLVAAVDDLMLSKRVLGPFIRFAIIHALNILSSSNPYSLSLSLLVFLF